ncbi:MAG: TlpA family protein disulfide reductase [Alphaproteobacteria bacterium]|nr:MAG: TlpA family protein disulfide reductase [Alphaproteobacteria bacterium]
MTDQGPAPSPKLNPRRVAVIALGCAAVALVATLVVGNFMPAQAGQCEPQALKAQVVDSAAVGNLAALNGTGTGRGYADLAFTDAAGASKSIADFAGKKLLVNFWASWCVPCRAEMPALQALATTYNSDGFEVVPINLDVGASGIEKARTFLDDAKLTLPLYPAPLQAFQRLQQQAVTVGLPTTVLLDEKGCELGVLQGPAEWDSPDGRAVIDALLST